MKNKVCSTFFCFYKIGKVRSEREIETELPLSVTFAALSRYSTQWWLWETLFQSHSFTSITQRLVHYITRMKLVKLEVKVNFKRNVSCPWHFHHWVGAACRTDSGDQFFIPTVSLRLRNYFVSDVDSVMSGSPVVSLKINRVQQKGGNNPVYPLTVCLHKTVINHAGYQASLHTPGKPGNRPRRGLIC